MDTSELTKVRPSWNEYFMGVAKIISSRHTCDRLAVGCVLVRDNVIVAQGYNGSISGHEHCDDVGHLMVDGGCKRTIHAEMNAILMCAREGISTKNTVAYVTHQPCPDCLKHLAQAGVKQIYFLHEYAHRYDNAFGKDIEMTHLKIQTT